LYGIRAVDTNDVMRLEADLLSMPLSSSMLLTVMIDPDIGDLSAVSPETIHSFQFLVLSGNHRRLALQAIKADPAKYSLMPMGFGIVKADVYKSKQVQIKYLEY